MDVVLLFGMVIAFLVVGVPIALGLIALPIPLDPPVTIATWPRKFEEPKSAFGSVS